MHHDVLIKHVRRFVIMCERKFCLNIAGMNSDEAERLPFTFYARCFTP
jgi:hypothetical protein